MADVGQDRARCGHSRHRSRALPVATGPPLNHVAEVETAPVPAGLVQPLLDQKAAAGRQALQESHQFSVGGTTTVACGLFGG